MASLGPWSGHAAGFVPACLAASSNPSPNSSLSTPEVLELRQRALRGLLVEALDREPDVHDHVLADLGVGNVLQAHVFAEAAEVDHRHQRAVLFLEAEDLPRNRENTSLSPHPCCRS